MSDPIEMMDFHEYPKKHILRDGTEVQVRPMRADDRDRLFAYLRILPPRDRRYLKHDVTQREVITNWCSHIDYDRVLPLLAVTNGKGGEKVVADGTLHTERHGWDTHVAKLRLTVHPDMRQKGLGSIMMRELIDRAHHRGIEKVQVEIRADNEAAVSVLQQMNFMKEAVLLKHAQDLEGNKHDVHIYYADLGELWQKMEDLNLDSDFFVIP